MPTTAVSGVYMAELVRNDTGGKSQIPFVVRDDASHSDIIYQTSDETWEAYNTWGGNSLYQCTGAPAPSSDTTRCPPATRRATRAPSRSPTTGPGTPRSTTAASPGSSTPSSR